MVTVNCEISYLLGRLVADTLLHYHQEQAGTPATARLRLHLQTKNIISGNHSSRNTSAHEFTRRHARTLGGGGGGLPVVLRHSLRIQTTPNQRLALTKRETAIGE